MICPRAGSSGEINKIRFKLANKGCCIYSYHRSATAAFLRPGLAQRYIARAAPERPKIMNINSPEKYCVASALKWVILAASASWAKKIFCPPETSCPAT